MNVFIKLMISVMLLGITQDVFSQPAHITPQKVDLPFYDGDAVRSFLKRQTDFDTLWLPAYELTWENEYPTERNTYEYHENGLLKKMTGHSPTGDLLWFYYYNNTYIDPLEDVLDTIFINAVSPPYRYYYNNRQADSSYWEEYYQVWDGEKWNTEQKTYVHLLDTATVSEFQDHVEIFDRDGNITRGHKAFLTFDEQGNVKEVLIEEYDVSAKQYKVTGKNVYLYDGEGKCHTRNQYLFTTPNIWELGNKLTDMKWFEFHGFNNGDMLFWGQEYGLYYLYSPKNKNKISDFKYWGTYGDGILYLHSFCTIKWSLEPFSYHYFNFSGYNDCLDSHDYYEYNEHYHRISSGRNLYNFWNCDTAPYSYLKDDYVNKYDDRGRRYEYIWYNTYHPEDTIYEVTLTFVVDSFTYVLNKVNIDELSLKSDAELLLVPNPTNETVRITAIDSIATIVVYASDGRLVHSQEGSGKEATVNLRGLSAGIYLVQARLRDGRVQTGKLVVRG
ncbi:MAG: T9SS type A sorting domain-containing protein [Bacteroidales bacterium]|nr:T9SS type A sorting domain-containing protein [Bacteroidales bacterium]